MAAVQRERFYIYVDHMEMMADLSAGDFRQLIGAMTALARGEEPEVLTGEARGLFRFIRGQMERDFADEEHRREVSRMNGRKGGRPRKNPAVMDTAETASPIGETAGQAEAQTAETAEHPFAENLQVILKPGKADTDTETETDTDAETDADAETETETETETESVTRHAASQLSLQQCLSVGATELSSLPCSEPERRHSCGWDGQSETDIARVRGKGQALRPCGTLSQSGCLSGLRSGIADMAVFVWAGLSFQLAVFSCQFSAAGSG